MGNAFTNSSSFSFANDMNHPACALGSFPFSHNRRLLNVGDSSELAKLVGFLQRTDTV